MNTKAGSLRHVLSISRSATPSVQCLDVDGCFQMPREHTPCELGEARNTRHLVRRPSQQKILSNFATKCEPTWPPLLDLRCTRSPTRLLSSAKSTDLVSGQTGLLPPTKNHAAPQTTAPAAVASGETEVPSCEGAGVFGAALRRFGLRRLSLRHLILRRFSLFSLRLASFTDRRKTARTMVNWQLAHRVLEGTRNGKHLLSEVPASTSREQRAVPQERYST